MRVTRLRQRRRRMPRWIRDRRGIARRANSTDVVEMQKDVDDLRVVSVCVVPKILHRRCFKGRGWDR